jgi:NADPH:quinone reductase-like Zn-dependent oxidoreductase
MRAVAVDEAGRLALTEVGDPDLAAGELLVGVRAISINRGEILRARAAGPGFRPGWDFAGVVERSCPGGPAAGARVTGYLKAGAWAERIAVPPSHVAVVTESLSLEAAATLPVAGLTALGALDAGGGLLGRKVLVTGASGGVGAFATNLAALSGARVTAVVRRSAEETRDLLPGAHEILSLQGGLAGAEKGGPYDLIIETVGGQTLADALTLLTPAGKCVTLGVTDSARVTFDAERFFMLGTARLEGFVLFRNRLETPAEGLTRLLRLVDRGDLPVEVALTERWENVEAVAERLIARAFVGKAVLTVGG